MKTKTIQTPCKMIDEDKSENAKLIVNAVNTFMYLVSEVYDRYKK